MSKTNKQHVEIVKQLFEDVYNNGNLSSMENYFTSDVKICDPSIPNMKKGLQGLKEVESMYKMAFPSKNTKIDRLWNANEDCVIASWSCQGTHKGTYQDIPPSGKSFKTTGISIYKFEGNKITEVTQNWDKFGLLEQLGLPLNAHAYRD